ncbi:TetR family transcriptional regulator [Streptomyces sp. GbtcB7]|uniref:TetR family transcriptional regulator n=1 Tax=Streptomyces sp. GbtcB7 TaxID=2824752 RepID=UPI001C30C592|nr:TetR family transcriptional regulator [Streptomyces sp. GbtcB7]
MSPERATALSPAQRRKARQRARIVQEAAALFEENGGEGGGGFEKTTVEAIAERSDISVSTFFRYFRTKADVIYVDLDNPIEEHLAVTAQRIAEGQEMTAAAFAAYTEAFADFAAEEGNWSRLERAMRSPHFYAPAAVGARRWADQLAGLFKEHLPAGPDREITARATANAVIFTSMAAVRCWVDAADADTPLAAYMHTAFTQASIALRKTTPDKGHSAET